MAAHKPRNSQAGNAWGILIGLTGIPVIAVLNKVYPDQHIIWTVGYVLFGLLALKSFVSYMFPRRARADQADANHSHAH